MPQQFSIKSILLLTAATAIGIVVLSPVIVSAQADGLFFSLTHALGFPSPFLALCSMLAIPAVTLEQIGRIVHQGRSIDRLLQLCVLPIFGLVFILCVRFDLELGYLAAIVGSVVSVLISLVFLLMAIIRNDRDRMKFASLSLLGAILAWHLSSTILYLIFGFMI